MSDIQPKSAEEIMEELKQFELEVPDGELKDCLVYHEVTQDFFREALASYALYLEGKMPDANKGDCRSERCWDWNNATGACKFILRREAEEVMKV